MRSISHAFLQQQKELAIDDLVPADDKMSGLLLVNLNCPFLGLHSSLNRPPSVGS